MPSNSNASGVLVVVAVLPEYREHFIRLVESQLEDRVQFAAGDRHLVSTVTSAESYTVPILRLKNKALLGRRLLWQQGALTRSRRFSVVVTDLNPRSLSAWAILLSRRPFKGKKTLVWGHILPRKGAEARTVPLRRLMRRLADGVISYTWTDGDIVRREDPGMPVWVAANGLYPISWIDPLGHDRETERTNFVYVGRLVEEKKPLLLVEGFARFVREFSDSRTRLVIVGDGPEMAGLRERVSALGIDERVEFRGHVSDFSELKEIYSTALASVSPGYVGLSLTQTLGFGVPMIVADDEPHAPEVELLTAETGVYFNANDPESLAGTMRAMVEDSQLWASRRKDLIGLVQRTYSADAMAEGFVEAIRTAWDGRRGSHHGNY